MTGPGGLLDSASSLLQLSCIGSRDEGHEDGFRRKPVQNRVGYAAKFHVQTDEGHE